MGGIQSQGLICASTVHRLMLSRKNSEAILQLSRFLSHQRPYLSLSAMHRETQRSQANVTTI